MDTNFMKSISLLMLLAAMCCAPAADELLVCGGPEVFLLDLNAAENGTVAKLWSWRASDRPELPAGIAGKFSSTDDCRPIADGKQVLISASSGACALVERPNGKVLWYAQVPNAHGVEWLPRNRIIAASSTHAAGNRLMLFDSTQSDHLLWETPLPSAHGVLWDAQRERLWALGHDELRCYALEAWAQAKPSLTLEATYPLPDSDGHDLSAVPQSDDLVVTTHAHVYLFGRNQRGFRPHPLLADHGLVKGVTIHPLSGRLVYVQADPTHWWGTSLHLLTPAGEVRLENERLYRPRWLPMP